MTPEERKAKLLEVAKSMGVTEEQFNRIAEKKKEYLSLLKKKMDKEVEKFHEMKPLLSEVLKVLKKIYFRKLCALRSF